MRELIPKQGEEDRETARRLGWARFYVERPSWLRVRPTIGTGRYGLAGEQVDSGLTSRAGEPLKRLRWLAVWLPSGETA